jgi:hypothetical protein
VEDAEEIRQDPEGWAEEEEEDLDMESPKRTANLSKVATRHLMRRGA